MQGGRAPWSRRGVSPGVWSGRGLRAGGGGKPGSCLVKGWPQGCRAAEVGGPGGVGGLTLCAVLRG